MMTKHWVYLLGFSLIELLIAMFVLSIVLVAIVSFQMFIISETQMIQRRIPFQWLLQSVKSSVQLQQWPLMNDSHICLPENLKFRKLKDYCLVDEFPKNFVDVCDSTSELQSHLLLGVCCVQSPDLSCWIGYQNLEDDSQQRYFELLPLIQ